MNNLSHSVLDESLRPYTPVVREVLPNPSQPWMIQCDFDGTISQVDVIDSLLERFGRPGWQELEDDWEAGRIGSRDCMQGQVALLDMSQEEFHAHLDGIAIDPGFQAFVEAAGERGLLIQVISDGLDYAIRYILRRHGLGGLPVQANYLTQTGERSWELASPFASPHCLRDSGTCKCERLALQHQRQQRVLFIGDSTSDFCVSGRVDFVLAKYKLIDHCRQRGYPFAPISTFNDALSWLDELVPQEQPSR